MPTARLLALAFCGYFSPVPVLRKSLRAQLYRCHHHISALGYRKRLSCLSAIHGLRLRAPDTTTAMASTASCRESFSSSSGAGEDAVTLDSAAAVYRYLCGRWELEKSIDYKVGGMAGSWVGVASFSPREHSSNSNTNANTGEGTEEESDTRASEESSGEDCSGFLRYLEQGIFRINGKGAGFQAGQRLVYDCGNEDGRVRVHFVDDPKQPDALRFFHELDFRRPSTAAATTAHSRGIGDTETKKGAACSGSGEAPAAARHPRAEFEHLCVRDMYRGQVEVVGPDEFRTRLVSREGPVGCVLYACLWPRLHGLLLFLGTADEGSAIKDVYLPAGRTNAVCTCARLTLAGCFACGGTRSFNWCCE